MTLRILLSIGIVSLFFSCAAQKKSFTEYDKYKWNAMLLYKTQKYEKALTMFKKAFEIIPNEDSSDYFFAASAALNLGKNVVAKDLIIESIVQTNAPKDYLTSFE